MAVQVAGSDGVTTQAVDSLYQAARVSLRPSQFLSYVSLGVPSGALAALTLNAPIFSLRNISSNLLVVRRIGIKFMVTTAFATPQAISFGLSAARSFTVSDSGGTAIALTGNNVKVRTSMQALTSVDCRISTTAALTAGTKVMDANYLSDDAGWMSVVGSAFGAVDNLLSQSSGDHPLILAQNEGINVVAASAWSGTGAGIAWINLEIAEATSY